MPAKGLDDARQHRFEDAALIQHGEGPADQQDEHDNGDDHHGIGSPEHFDGGCEPAPNGVINTRGDLIGIRVDHRTAVQQAALKTAGGQHAREQTGYQHQQQDDQGGLEEGFLADLCTGFFVHERPLFFLILLSVAVEGKIVNSVGLCFPKKSIAGKIHCIGK